MAITAAVVNELRQATGCGLMDCKKALIECEGDMEKAVMYLREKGLASQAKKASRVAAEGMAYATVIDGVGVVVEVNCETDFVANGEPFNNFVKGVAAVAAKENPADVDALMGCPWVTGNGTVKDAKDELFLAIRENMSIRRFARIADGFSVPYVHMKGKIGVIVNLTVEGCDATEIGKDIAMQIAALNPRFWDKSQVTQDVLDEEKEVMLGQMANDPEDGQQARSGQGKDRYGQAQQVLCRELPASAGLRQGRRRLCRAVYEQRCQGAGRQGQLQHRRSLREGRGH